MKLIIDIPTDHYNEIVFQDVDKLRECVKNGTVVVNEAGVDCVNRLDVLAILFNAYKESRFDGYSDYCAVSDLVADLPTLEPQRPKGKWIVLREEKEFMGSIVNEPRGCKCSNCNKVVRFKSDFCPICGAEMEGEEC